MFYHKCCRFSKTKNPQFVHCKLTLKLFFNNVARKIENNHYLRHLTMLRPLGNPQVSMGTGTSWRELQNPPLDIFTSHVNLWLTAPHWSSRLGCKNVGGERNICTAGKECGNQWQLVGLANKRKHVVCSTDCLSCFENSANFWKIVIFIWNNFRKIKVWLQRILFCLTYICYN